MINTDLKLLLKDFYPFDMLPEDQLFQLIHSSTFTTFAKNEFLFLEDQAIEEVDIYFLVSGLAKNILHKENGKQISLRYYYPGDIVGLMVMFTSGDMNFSVQALEECTVFKLNKVHFFEVMTKNQAFSKIIWESIGQRMQSIYNEIKTNSSKDDDVNIVLLTTRVKELMDQAVFIDPNETMFLAAEKMKNSHLSGLVVSENSSSLEGTITQNEILNYVSNYKHSHRVRDWQQQSAIVVDADSFAYEALSYMKNHQIDFIPVLHKSKVIGVLTSRSFLNLNASNYLDLTYNIKNTRDLNKLLNLAPLSNTLLQSFTRELVDNNQYGYEITEMITKHNNLLFRQLIKFVESEMKAKGFGPPPINYCFIVMGSQARGEQSFHTDQDNGMITSDFQHLPYREKISRYFDVFTEKINNYLASAGFSECTGGIMAKELKWRKSVTEWKKEILQWKKAMDAEEIQRFTMFYDFLPIYGDFSLAKEVRLFLIEKTRNSKTLQHLLTKDALRFKLPLNPLGKINLIKHKDRKLNVKKTGMIQIINSTRINAMKYGITEISTIKRLDALKKLNALHPRDVQNAKTALHYLQYYRLKQNLNEISNQQPLSNEIGFHELSNDDRQKLKEAIHVANRMQQVLKISFNRNRGI